MSRLLGMCLLGCGLLGLRVAGAQEDAARAANREASEESYRRLNSAVEDLMASQLETRRQLDKITESLQRVSVEARSKPSDNTFVTREEFNKLKDIVRDIDAKRVADAEEIKQRIDELGKSLSASVKEAARRTAEASRAAPEPRPEPRSSSPPAAAGTAVPQDGVYYTVEKGNTLSAIVNAHNEQLKKQGLRTSLKLVLAANPKVKPENIYVGQKLFIPLEKIDGAR